MAKLFTDEELEELRRADAELEEEFTLTKEDLDRSRILDREAKLDKLDNRGRRKAAQKAAYREANKDKIAAQKAAYYEANKDKIAAQKAAYREANKDKIAAQQAAYYEANKKKLLDYQRRYRQKKREAKKNAASRCARPERRHGLITNDSVSQKGTLFNDRNQNQTAQP